MTGNPSKNSKTVFKLVVGFYALLFITSCAVVTKDYPKNTPFVYDYSIKIDDDSLSKEKKEELLSGLQNQLDDSINLGYKRKLLYKGINRKVLEKPPVYKQDYADESVRFMGALMTSLGYFYDSIGYSTTIDTVNAEELRTTIDFTVKPGKITKLDSIVYNIDSPLYHSSQKELQRITNQNMDGKLIEKGTPFAKANIAAELDRLVQLYRNAGYFRIMREDLVGLWDTLGKEALIVSFDPLEQIMQLQRLKEKRENPSSDLEIRFLPIQDSSRFRKYYVGNVNVFPAHGFAETNLPETKVEVDTNLYVIQSLKKFNSNIFPSSIFIKHGALYSQRRVQRTINRLNNMGAWEVINVQPEVRDGQDTVDFNIFLTPKTKYQFGANLEAAQNNSIISGNLFGIGGDISVQNRNLFKTANQSKFNIRYGVEIAIGKTTDFIQTQQFGAGYNIYFPRFVGPEFIKRSIQEKQMETNWRSVLSINAANTERKTLYNISTFNASFGWDFNRARPNSNVTKYHQLKYNIEYSKLIERDSLTKLIQQNPSLRNIFTDGLVESWSGSMSWTWTKPNKPQSNLTLNGELAGVVGLSSLMGGNFIDTNLYRFIKLSAEYTRHYKLGLNSAFVVRGFLGAGYEFEFTKNPKKKAALPFFKQYYAGGPNSMRAWRIRRLGPGSHLANANNPERFGDVQLELNAEYRFKLLSFGSMKLESVVFTDMGNIWLLKPEAGAPDEVFKPNRLYNDLAIGVGTGLRLDISMVIIRLDYSYKAKDPTPLNPNAQNKWFYDWKPFGGQVQIGINYPFKL